MLKEFDVTQFQEYGNVKAHVARVLGITRPMLYEAHDVALELIPDYRRDFPKIGEEVYSRAPLTLYQCYVLWALRFWKSARGLPFECIKDKIFSDREFSLKFGKKHFETLYPTHEEDNELTAICRIA